MLLRAARRKGHDATFAYHIVGASLQMAFPNLNIHSQANDAITLLRDTSGDFLIGDTVFHVTVAPSSALFEKCKTNLTQGYRVYVLVPERSVAAARQLAELAAPGNITCLSLESFVGQNIDEISSFSKPALLNEFRSLLEAYNQRVDEVESDKSLLIEIPRLLLLET